MSTMTTRRGCRRTRECVSKAAPLFLLMVACTVEPQWILGAGPVVPAVMFSSKADHVLVSLSYDISRVKTQDTTPIVRVYGDGRVHVHCPAYMSRRGDYQLRLSPAELTSLLQSITAQGALTFNADATIGRRAAVQTARAEHAQRQEKSHEELDVGDSETVELSVNLDVVVMPDGTRFEGPMAKRTVRWTNLQSDLQLFPELTELADLDKCIKTIRALAKHTRLMRVQGGSTE